MSSNLMTREAAYALVPEEEKKLVREGKLSMDAAISKALKNLPAEKPEAPPAARKSLDEGYDAGVAVETGTRRAGQSIDAAQAGGYLAVGENLRKAELAKRESFLETLQRNAVETYSKFGGVDYANPVAIPQALIQTVTDTVSQKALATSSDEKLKGGQGVALQEANEQVGQIIAAQKIIDSLPKDQYTPAMVDALNKGDYLEAIKNLPASTANQIVEQTPTLALQAGMTGGTALVTKNPAATIAAARASGAVGGYQELGSDFYEVYSKLSEEDKANPTKVKEAFDTAVNASTARAAIEGGLPGLGKLATAGKPIVKQVVGNVASQFIGDAGGELVASTVKGDTASFGEIVAEGLGGIAGAATESGMELRQEAIKLKQTQTQFDKTQAELDQAVDSNISNQKATEELVKEVDAAEPTQTEVDVIAPVQGELFSKPSEPVIQDMFGGGVQTATEVETQAQIARQAVQDSGVPTIVQGETQAEFEKRKADGPKPLPENQAQFEQRKARESIASTKIEDTQQATFEERKAFELARKEEETKAQETLKNKKTILDVGSINQEAQARLKQEVVNLTRRAGNRTPEGLARLPETIAQYVNKRLPEIAAIVKEERVGTVKGAQRTIKTAEEREVARQLMKDDAELAKAEEKRNQKENPKTNLSTAKQQSLLLEDSDQQPDLFGTMPNEPGYTGSLTEEQAVTEAKRLGAIREAKIEAGEPATVSKEQQALQSTEDAKQVEAIAGKLTPELEKQDAKNGVAQTKAYAVAEAAVRKNIAEEVNASMPGAPVADRAKAIATKLIAWQKANPKGKSVGKVIKTTTLTEKVEANYKAAESKDKAAKTKQETKEIDILRKKGMTITEAVEALKNRKEEDKGKPLSKADDAAARELLGQKPAATPLREGTDRPARRDTDPAFYNVIQDSLGDREKGLQDILQFMADSSRTSPSYKVIAKLLFNIVKQLEVGIAPMTKEGKDNKWDGYYDPKSNMIYIDSAHPEVTLHEALHAVLLNIFNKRGPFGEKGSINSTAHRIATQMKSLLQHSTDYIRDNPSKFTQAERDWINNHMMGPKGVLVEDGALYNIDEFVSYAMTSDMAAGILRKIPAKGSVKPWVTNVLRQMVDAIKTTMGWDVEGSVLEQVFAATENALSFAEVNVKGIKKAQEDVADNANMYPLSSPEAAPLNRTDVPLKIKGKEIMSISNDTKNNPFGKLVDILTGAYGNNKGITEILERRSGLINEYSQRTEARNRSKDSELRAQAKREGKKLSELYKEYNAAIADLESVENTSPLQPRLNTFSERFGHAARNYLDERREIDTLSNAIVSERLKDPTPLTDDELGSYLKMKEQLGRYYTRAYATNLRGVGQKLYNATKKAWDAFKAGNPTVEEAELANTYKDAVEIIKDSHVIIPDDEDLNKYSSDRLAVLAQVWGIKKSAAEAGTSSRESLIDAISDFRDNKMTEADHDMAQNRAEQLADELLAGSNDGALVTYFRGGKQDRTVVEHREDIPAPIRKLMGEYTDINLKAMTTILKQSEFLFRTAALREVYEYESARGDESRILSPEQVAKRGVDTKNWRQLQGETYGILNGLYVEKSLANRLDDTTSIETSIKAMWEKVPESGVKDLSLAIGKMAAEGYIVANGWMKAMQLVFNPTNAGLNFVGGPYILLSNGNINPKDIKTHFAKASWTAGKLVASQVKGVVDADISTIIRANQIDSAYMGSIRDTELEIALQLVEASLGNLEARDKVQLWQKSKDGVRMSKEVYAMADVVWKLTNYYYREDFLTKYHEANGDGTTKEQIERDAASDNTSTNFSFSRNPTIVKMMDKATPFYIAGYMYQAFKAPISNLFLGYADIMRSKTANNEEAASMMRYHGAKRLAGAAVSLTIAQGVVRFILGTVSEVVGGGDDEEEQKKIDGLRGVMAPYQKYDDYFYAGKNTKGQDVTYSLSRLQPFGPASQFWSMAMRDAPADDYAEAFKSLFITNKYGPNLLEGFFGLTDSDGATVDDARLKRSMPWVWDKVSQVSERSAKALDTGMPSWIARGMDPNNEATLTSDRTGFLKAAEQAFTAMTKYGGGEMTVVNKEKTLGFAVRDFGLEQKAATTELTNRVKDDSNLEPNELAELYIEATERERESYDKVSAVYETLKKLKYTDAQIQGVMKKEGRGKISDKDIALIANGTYSIDRSRILTATKLESLKKAIRNSKGTVTNKTTMMNNFNTLIKAIDEGTVKVSKE